MTLDFVVDDQISSALMTMTCVLSNKNGHRTVRSTIQALSVLYAWHSYLSLSVIFDHDPKCMFEVSSEYLR